VGEFGEPVPEVPQESIDNLICKRRGEVAELAFMHKAISTGFRVAKPWGDSDPFDFVVCHDKLLSRVQVKSVWTKRVGYCVNNAGTDNTPYTLNETDFLVAYLGPEDLWYILPIAILKGRRRIYLSPWSRKATEFKKYIEAWGLFRGEEPPEPEPHKSRRHQRRTPSAPVAGCLELKSWKPGGEIREG
jgi:hypothetical protein